MAHHKCPQWVNELVRPWHGVSLSFILHPSVLEPNLERVRTRKMQERQVRNKKKEQHKERTFEE